MPIHESVGEPSKSTQDWTPSTDRRKRTQSRFNSFKDLKTHFTTLIPLDQIEETIRVETAIFVIRRDSTLGQIRTQLLIRLESVFESVSRGRKMPDLPFIPNSSEATRPYLR